MNWILILYYFLIALVISIIWCIVGRKEYGYNKKFRTILGMNAFPLIAWILGLTATMIASDFVNYWFNISATYSQFGAFLLIYWPVLLALETIGYHVFDVHNEATAKHKGIPILNCMHAPTWMKIVYFSLGPLMFLVCKFLIIIN